MKSSLREIDLQLRRDLIMTRIDHDMSDMSDEERYFWLDWIAYHVQSRREASRC